MARKSFNRKDRARISEVVNYDAETGKLTWKVRQPYSDAEIGDEIGSLSQGYRRVKISGQSHMCHRIAWLLHYGADAPDFIDHINGDRADNRIANLRVVSKSENAKNRGAYKRLKKTLPKGVTFHPATGKFRARIRCDGVLHSLGLFDTPEAAHARYCDAAAEFFGRYAREGSNAF